MKLHLTTTTGSEYVIDDTTWQRIDFTERSGKLRSGGTGKLWSVMTIIEDKTLLIEGPPVDPAMQMRIIRTTPIVKWWPEASRKAEE
jgi:hypothetical protein